MPVSFANARVAHGSFAGLQVHDKVGQNQRAARTMEEGDLAEAAAARNDRLLKVISPRRWRVLVKIVVEPHAPIF